MEIKKLSRSVKMGKGTKPYMYGLFGAKTDLNPASLKALYDMIVRECAKGYYFGYQNALLFEDRSDADYFAMKAAFLKSEQGQMIQMTNPQWKSSYLYNYGLQVKNSSPVVIASSV